MLRNVRKIERLGNYVTKSLPWKKILSLENICSRDAVANKLSVHFSTIYFSIASQYLVCCHVTSINLAALPIYYTRDITRMAAWYSSLYREHSILRNDVFHSTIMRQDDSKGHQKTFDTNFRQALLLHQYINLQLYVLTLLEKFRNQKLNLKF